LRPQNRKYAGVSALTLIGLLSIIVVIGAIFVFANPLCLYFCGTKDYFGPTLSSVKLYAGTASSINARGSASFTIALNNAGPSTSIISISLSGSALSSPITVLQCSNGSSCAELMTSPPYSARLGEGITYFDSNTTAFYLSAPITIGDNYSYIVSFQSGQSISGTVTAQPFEPLPAGPPMSYTNAISTTSTINTMDSGYSTSTCANYSTTETINSSNTLYTTIATVYC
jgi:hypothetical protein